MDGSTSTLAAILAVAFATPNCWAAVAFGLAARAGADISMEFVVAVSDGAAYRAGTFGFIRAEIQNS